MSNPIVRLKFEAMMEFGFKLDAFEKDIYKDSKLSSLKHGFLRTFKKIDESLFINKENKINM